MIREAQRPGDQTRAPQRASITTELQGQRTATQLEIGQSLRDEGRDLALDAASALWRAWAWGAIEQYAASGQDFTSADVRDRAGDPIGNGSLNAWGGLFSQAVKSGLIRRVGSIQSPRPTAHARWIAVYRGAR